jgi:asparagine N-glycosylation enzyme membrane subunit Stt3
VFLSQSAFALTLQQISDEAISRTKRQVGYGTYTLNTNNGSTTVRLQKNESEQFEGEFRSAINSADTYTKAANT